MSTIETSPTPQLFLELEYSPEDRKPKVQYLLSQYKLNYPIPENQRRKRTSNTIELINEITHKIQTYEITYSPSTINQEEAVVIREESLNANRSPSFEVFDGPNSGWVKNTVPISPGAPKIGLPSVLLEIEILFDKLMPIKPNDSKTSEEDKFKTFGP